MYAGMFAGPGRDVVAWKSALLYEASFVSPFSAGFMGYIDVHIFPRGRWFGRPVTFSHKSMGMSGRLPTC